MAILERKGIGKLLLRFPHTMKHPVGASFDVHHYKPHPCWACPPRLTITTSSGIRKLNIAFLQGAIVHNNTRKS